MEYEKIKQLIDDMSGSELSEINIDFPDGTKISMKKEIKQQSIVMPTEIIHENKQVSNNIEEPKEDKKSKDNGNIVKSPMVGTFYMKPSPTSEPYVELGKEIKKGETLCIIEAMKLMNEIESEFSGKLTEIFVKDGETVEYGTPLFRIEM